MNAFSKDFIENYFSLTKNRESDFGNILKILRREKPSRYTLFEFFLNGELEVFLSGSDAYPKDVLSIEQMRIAAFKAAGLKPVEALRRE